MNGLAPYTAEVFEELSTLTCVKDYCLIGGTALALQLNHRLSEDRVKSLATIRDTVCHNIVLTPRQR